MKTRQGNLRRIIDICMTVLLLLQMAYQVTGEAAHEWLGMAMTATALGDGQLVRNVVLFSVLVYELVGPMLTRSALLRAGEIQPEGKTSARVHNKPRPHFSLH